MMTKNFDFALGEYRGYLSLLARSQWDSYLLRKWGEPSDLVQEVIKEALRIRERFSGETSGAYKAWLRAILANQLRKVIGYCRKKKRDYRRIESLDAELEGSSARLGSWVTGGDPTPSEVAVTLERLNCLEDALARLSDDHLAAVTNHHLKGLSLKETARLMGRTEPAVAGLLRRGLGHLSELMAKVTNE